MEKLQEISSFVSYLRTVVGKATSGEQTCKCAVQCTGHISTSDKHLPNIPAVGI